MGVYVGLVSWALGVPSAQQGDPLVRESQRSMGRSAKTLDQTTRNMFLQRPLMLSVPLSLPGFMGFPLQTPGSY